MLMRGDPGNVPARLTLTRPVCAGASRYQIAWSSGGEKQLGSCTSRVAVVVSTMSVNGRLDTTVAFAALSFGGPPTGGTAVVSMLIPPLMALALLPARSV